MAQIQNQPVALRAIGAQQKTVDLHGGCQIKNDARVALTEVAGTNGFDRRVFQRQLTEVALKPRAADIDDDPLRRAEREGLVLNRAAEVEHEPQLVIGTPQACVSDLRRVD